MIRGEHYGSIPTDLIPEILSRLFGKSKARFRCVSKLWRSILISRPRLVFALERVNNELLFFSSPLPKNPYEKSSLVVTADFHMKFSKDMWPEFGGLTSGLIYLSDMLISEKDWVRKIYNLNTGWNMTLPKLHRYRKCNSFFGFDPVDKQFKVLLMGYIGGPDTDDHRIVTLRTGKKKWRKIECPLRHQPLFDCISINGICINGVLYYIGEEDEVGGGYLIICFDVRSETFKFVDVECFRDSQTTKLINYKGKLCGIDLTYNDSDAIVLCMWILEDVEREEWSKYIYTLPVNDISNVFVVGVTATGDIVFSEKVTSKPFCIFYFSPERNTLQRVEIEVLENTMKLLRLIAEFVHL